MTTTLNTDERIVDPPLDPGLPRTWSDDIVEFVRDTIASYDLGQVASCDDFADVDEELSVATETRFKDTLGDRRTLAYHATCLLRHEAQWVATEGILPLTRQLVERRITGARELLPDLIDDEAEGLLFGAFTQSIRTAKRLDRAFFFSPIQTIGGGSDTTNLTHHWGGEVISRTIDPRTRELLAKITQHAKPTLVELVLPAAAFGGLTPLWKVFAAHKLGFNRLAIGCPSQIELTDHHVVSLLTPESERWPASLR